MLDFQAATLHQADIFAGAVELETSQRLRIDRAARAALR
jgi:hypothetical protein